MTNLPVRVSKNSLSRINSLFIPQQISPNTNLSLILTLDDKNLAVRDFGVYLVLIDRVYGRLQPEGLTSYSHKQNGRVQINEVHTGSIELVITQAISQIKDATPLVLLCLFLQKLPNIIRSSASAYRDFEQGRYYREDRKNKELLRRQLENSESTKDLDRATLNKLVSLLDALSASEHRSLPVSSRFAVKHVRNIALKLRDEETEQS